MKEIIEFIKDDPAEIIQGSLAFGSLLVIVFMLMVIGG